MFGLARERSRPPVACRQRSPRLPTSETTMMSVSHASTRAALALVLASVSWSAGAAAQGPRSALDPITSAVINHPITTSSAEARAHFLEGLRESIAQALALSPKLYVAHVIMGNNSIFGEPRDFTKALGHMQEAEALAPDESNAHMFVGDAYRAQKNLEKAREEYLRGHALEPRNAVLLVKAGHADTFLGDYAAARADYDSAMALGRANEKAAYAPFRAYVSVYAGDPAAAIAELNRLVASVDGMGVPDPKTNKVAALTNVVVIATHTKNRAAVEQALKQLEPLLMQQAEEAGNPAFVRGRRAQIAYLEGWWAARRGDYTAAQTQADRISQLLEPDANPRKLEPMHQLKGFIALYQGKYQEAAGHLRQANPFDPYIKYQLAVATEGAGDAAQAKKLFQEVADYNFNALGFALVRKEAQQKAGRSAL